MIAWYEPALVLLVIAAMLAAFISDRYRPDMVALAVPVVFLVTGIVDVGEALQSFSQPAPFTVACMFVLSAALERTGCIDWLGRTLLRVTAGSKFATFVALILTAAVASSVVNNTAVVVVLIPVVFRIASAVKLVPSRLLLPLSYAAIFGGTCTLFGTSTNLVTDGIAREAGLAPFGVFEITPLGLIFSAVGIAYLTFAYKFLPERPPVTSALEELPPRPFVTELVVPAYSQLIGKTLADAGLDKLKGADVIDVIRFDVSKRKMLGGLKFVKGDRLLVRGEVAGLLELRKHTGLETVDANLAEAGTQKTSLVEGVVGPSSRFVGHGLSEFNLRRQFNIHALAIHRQGEALDLTLDSVHFKVGDCLLLEGPTEGFRKLMETGNVVAITEMRERLYNKSRAPIAIGTIAMVMLLSAYNILSIEGAAFLGVLLVYVSGCLSRRDLERAIEWRVLVIIYSMLIVGSAMRLSGAQDILVGGAAGAGGINPYVALAALYLVTILVTEVVTNNAAAILLAPIAIGMAETLGVDPRPFVVAVMFAASTSFASPIGYQTNTLVYTAGGYRYMDFLRAGVPLTCLYWVLAVFFIPYFWPFAAAQN